MAESNKSILKQINQCPISRKGPGSTYLNLGDMPLVNNLSLSKEESLSCDKYPLAVQYFSESRLSMLTHAIEPEILYSNYYYKSGISQPYVKHCREMYAYLNSKCMLKENASVLDIGGNDGTLLYEFLKLNPKLNVINVDASANLTALSLTKGVDTLNSFWGLDTARKVNRKFNIIISTNVFQHTEHINDFVEAISVSLTEDGIWCLEFPYWNHSMETKQYDQVYHEHLYYYNVAPLASLFKKYGLKIIDTGFTEIHGGSLRLLTALDTNPTPETTFTEAEKTFAEYREWGQSIEEHIKASKEYLLNLKQQGYSIAGFGAAAKGCIFLNSSGIDHTVLDYVIDDTDLKQGKFIPGTGIEIVSREKLKQTPVDYIVILAHNFADYISRSLTSYTGKLIVFFPEITIL